MVTASAFNKIIPQETSRGIGEPRVSGYTVVIGGESSPTPLGASSIEGAGSRSPLEPRGGLERGLAGVVGAEAERSEAEGYLEPEAKVPSTLRNHEQLPCKEKRPEDVCGRQIITAICPEGHRFAKALFCGREWCPKCRDKTQLRRVSRWLPKVMQMKSMGYWVITFPLEVRSFMRSKKSLRTMSKKVREAMKELGYSRGLIRYHYFGEKSTRYHPHLNILVDGGYLEEEQLERQKDYLRRRIFKRSMAKALGKDLDINYHYRTSPGKIYHSLKYVCKASFLARNWDNELAEELFGFRNCNYWGQWNEPPKWSVKGKDKKLEASIALGSNRCPLCGQKLKWGKEILPIALIMNGSAIEVAAGYYVLPRIKSPPAWLKAPKPEVELTADEKMRLFLIRQERRGKPISPPLLKRIKLTDFERKWFGLHN